MRLLLASLVALTAPLSALADGGVTVPLPELSDLDPGSFHVLLRSLVTSNVVSENCPGFEVTMGEFALLTGTADRIAEAMGLSIEDYDRLYYFPAFAALDKPDICARMGPRVAQDIEMLVALGGGTEPLPD